MLAAVVVVSLAIGIGVNTSVFSWLQARLLTPLPGVAESAELRLIEPLNDSGQFVGSSWPEYLDLRERLQTMSDLIASRTFPAYIGEPGSVERVFGSLVSDNYFSALRVQAVVGRTFQASDLDVDREDPVVVISTGLWKSRFGSASDIVGRNMRVNSQPMTIVGVVPDEFQGTHFGLNFDLWTPATLAPLLAQGSTELRAREARGYGVLGRLAPGTSDQDAQQEVAAAMQALALAFPDTNANITASVLTLQEAPRGPQRMFATALVTLQGLMLLLWLAVCGNTATLILARTTSRYRDVSIRLALGATPGRIRSLLLTETMLLGVTAAVLGGALAVWGTRVLMVLPMTGFPIRFQTPMDAGGLTFALALGALSGLIVGAGPAWQLSRLAPQTVFRTAVTAAGRSGLRNALMAAQVALAVIVLVVAGLFVQSVRDTHVTDPGFTRDGILLATFDKSGRPSAIAASRDFATRLLEDLARVPGVESAAIATSVPLDIHGLPSRSFVVDGKRRADGDLDRALANTVTPGYFDTLQIPVLAGRDFAPLTDTAASAQVIVNDAFVRRYIDEFAPLETALGRGIDTRNRTQVIVGVVATSLSDAFGEPPTPAMYFSYRDEAPSMGDIHVRTRPGAEVAMASEVRRVVQAIDRDLPVFNVRTMTQHIDTNLVFRRIPARIFSVLAPLLLLLVAAGIYAVVSYTTHLRTRDIGVRLALGATPQRMVAESVGSHMRVVTAGAVVGWMVVFVGVLALVPSAVSGMSAFIGVPLLMLVVAGIACWIPSRRCAGVDSVISLRSE